MRLYFDEMTKTHYKSAVDKGQILKFKTYFHFYRLFKSLKLEKYWSTTITLVNMPGGKPVRILWK